MIQFLPRSLQRPYRKLLDAVPYARGTRPAPPKPEPVEPESGRVRRFRLEIIQDAFCERRSPPKVLLRPAKAPREPHSWCEARNRWTGRRCHS